MQKEIQELGISPLPLSELYKYVELTEEEKNEAIEKALFEARYAKHAQIESEKYWQKLTQPVEVKKYSADQLYQFLDDDPNFTIDNDNENIVRLLCQYVSEDPAFETAGYSHKKGILLFGGVGVGKTFLLEFFQNNQKQSYQLVTCQDVEATYAKAGVDGDAKTGSKGISKYFGLHSLSVANKFGQKTLGFFFDDLGQEVTNTKYFGTERNVMQEVLTMRYRNGLFTSTHLTTNLSGDQIKDVYGVRVADRMREMFNIIAFPSSAKSRRR